MPTEDTSTDPEGQEPEGDEQDTDEAEIEGLDDSAKSKIQKVNKEAQALRKRAKAAEDRLAEIDAANKTDAEKAADRLADAEKKATEAQARADRLEVAAAKGLTPSQAKHLQGSTVEELEADADELLAEGSGGAGTLIAVGRLIERAQKRQTKLRQQLIPRIHTHIGEDVQARFEEMTR